MESRKPAVTLQHMDKHDKPGLLFLLQHQQLTCTDEAQRLLHPGSAEHL